MLSAMPLDAAGGWVSTALCEPLVGEATCAPPAAAPSAAPPHTAATELRQPVQGLQTRRNSQSNPRPQPVQGQPRQWTVRTSGPIHRTPPVRAIWISSEDDPRHWAARTVPVYDWLVRRQNGHSAAARLLAPTDLSGARTAARRAVIQRVRVADRPVVPPARNRPDLYFMQHRARNQRPHSR
jgi:hypothetical protein